MKTSYILLCISAMAVVTYIIRALPMVIFRQKIKNKWVKSFLYYVPYTVLASMTFPAVFYSTGSVASGVAGCVVAITLSYFRRGLLTVALGSALASFIFILMGF